ncbi:FadR/GntR family transcriptional regulator [Cumulibacter manganitolerans]|uniref:FadR/GntR family transcriptional regulator n=1 Tax=Cumulibacter manganitolerans TaxID=1884992 RepID=UPI0012959E4D|nr:FCD domain-containing protein [Cumulibacter manganitolerans]
MQTRSRAELAADLIGVISSDVPSGGRMGTKEELRARAGVSVGTFNEALRLAQTRGVVRVKPGPGGGVFAADQQGMVRLANVVLALDIDAGAVEQAIRLRDALDPLLVEDAIDHARPSDIERLRALAEEMERVDEEDGGLAVTKVIWRLHAAIAAISPNQMISSIYEGLLDLIEKHTVGVADAQPPAHTGDRVRLHRDIVEAIADRDATRAAELMVDHQIAARRRG